MFMLYVYSANERFQVCWNHIIFLPGAFLKVSTSISKMLGISCLMQCYTNMKDFLSVITTTSIKKFMELVMPAIKEGKVVYVEDIDEGLESISPRWAIHLSECQETTCWSCVGILKLPYVVEMHWAMCFQSFVKMSWPCVWYRLCLFH